MKQLLYVLKQCEKLMTPQSYNMMKKAVFTVRQKSGGLCVGDLLGNGEGQALDGNEARRRACGAVV